ncbi:lysylphosphatidylglycerol synthase domain-containing protein [Nannocystaceae bacterium ST9]
MAPGSTEQLEVSEDPTRRRLESLARLVFGLALFGLVLYLLAPDWSELVDRVELHLGWLLVGLLGTTLASLVTAARWQLLAEVMGGNRLPYVAYFYGLVWTRLAGQFTSTLAMDLVGRGVALRSAGSKRGLGHAATQVVLERLLDLVLPILLLGWALALRYDTLGTWVGEWPGLSLLAVALVFLLAAVPLLEPSVGVALRVYLAIRLRLGRRRRAEVEAEVAASGSETHLVPAVDLRLSAEVALLSLLRFAFVIVQFWGIAGAVGLTIGWVEMSQATPFAQLAGMIGLAPGGLGMLEVGWAGGLGFVGADAIAISLFVLAQRAGVIAFFGALTAASWPLARRSATKPATNDPT